MKLSNRFFFVFLIVGISIPSILGGFIIGSFSTANADKEFREFGGSEEFYKWLVANPYEVQIKGEGTFSGEGNDCDEFYYDWYYKKAISNRYYLSVIPVKNGLVYGVKLDTLMGEWESFALMAVTGNDIWVAKALPYYPGWQVVRVEVRTNDPEWAEIYNSRNR